MTTYKIKVTDKDGTIAVDTPKLIMEMGDVVTWVLTEDSELAAWLTINFEDEDVFSSQQFGLNKHHFSLTAMKPGDFNYTIASASGYSLDPEIIINPPGVGGE
jgi:plastocyanin